MTFFNFFFHGPQLHDCHHRNVHHRAIRHDCQSKAQVVVICAVFGDAQVRPSCESRPNAVGARPGPTDMAYDLYQCFSKSVFSLLLFTLFPVSTHSQSTSLEPWPLLIMSFLFTWDVKDSRDGARTNALLQLGESSGNVCFPRKEDLVMEKVVDIVHSDYSCPVPESGDLSRGGGRLSLKVMSIKCSF